MNKLASSLLQDECGFIVSAELILVATVLVIGLIVGMSEIQHAVNAELNDVADAIGSLNQSYFYTGFSATKMDGSIKSAVEGSSFDDVADDCDNNQCDIACDYPRAEYMKMGGND